MKLPHIEVDASRWMMTVVLVTDVLLLCYRCCHAVDKQRRRSRLSSSGGAPAINCRPVPHDVLWYKLDLHPAGAHTLRRSGTQPNQSQTGKKQRTTQTAAEFLYTIPRRIRRSQAHDPTHADVLDDLESAPDARPELLRRIARDGDSSATSAAARKSPSRRLRQLRHRLRRQHSARRNVHQCRLESDWRRMPRSVFPPFIETGRCVHSTCLAGLYECTPRRYTLKILRRVPRRCNPLPAVGVNGTAYEHAWTFADYQVTVGCDCARRRRAGVVSGRTESPDQR